MAENATIVFVSPKKNEDGDFAQCVDAEMRVRSSSPASDTSASSALTEQRAIDDGTDAESVVSSPASRIVELSIESKNDSTVRPVGRISEGLQVSVSFEVMDQTCGDSPVFVSCVERSCGQLESPAGRVLIAAVTDWSEKENPCSPRTLENDLNASPNVLRAPMKPARMSILNQTFRTASVRRRLNFDGL
ncbi:hypothetical protein MPTK1_6g06820 [Marchantia polymorpha subsp. ruderalis]|uniref:Uncharacterized protein n=2 Tax=Marchantia polymorpha TaxID=3197 RepID=A0AAF6BPA2_MARPO|nr:hypothetical protein MARPO_0173s0027 [Marchantia polymorpha]BBN13836.1 hypothetical protein Mp_6g06820 [Marchantia polymorpha subsp. ruderalis]|eukprot:PTQ28125.1 hypothetical protein MARPO_0173s0027 [Marchantia polymorpha]